VAIFVSPLNFEFDMRLEKEDVVGGRIPPGLLPPEAMCFCLDASGHLRYRRRRHFECIRDLAWRVTEGIRRHEDPFTGSQLVLEELRSAEVALFEREVCHLFSYEPHPPNGWAMIRKLIHGPRL
jgi:hypothetical protein